MAKALNEDELKAENDRKSHRQRTLLTGQIMFLDKHCMMECTIRNKSETGCQLSLENFIGIPDEFYLNTNAGDCYHCKVVWRSKNRIGVTFIF